MINFNVSVHITIKQSESLLGEVRLNIRIIEHRTESVKVCREGRHLTKVWMKQRHWKVRRVVTRLVMRRTDLVLGCGR